MRSHKTKHPQSRKFYHRVRTYEDKLFPIKGQQRVSSSDSLAVKQAGFGSLDELEQRLAAIKPKILPDLADT